MAQRTAEKKPVAAPRAPNPRQPAAGKSTSGGKWRAFRWGRLLIISFATLLLLPIVEVGTVRFLNPPATPLMGIRWLQDHASGEHPPRVLYHWVPWSALPANFLRAAWVSEDSRFFVHHGFDWVEIRHAIDKAKKTGGDPRGSSTITMQCARSLFLWQGHSYVRKGLEAYYTVLMEAMLSKRRILELYANVIEMGPGVYGIEAACEYHFKESSRHLSSEQAAMLAALLPNPRKWNPRLPSKRLLWRQQHILRELPADPLEWARASALNLGRKHRLKPPHDHSWSDHRRPSGRQAACASRDPVDRWKLA